MSLMLDDKGDKTLGPGSLFGRTEKANIESAAPLAVRMMPRIAEKIGFFTGAMAEVRHNIDDEHPNSYFCDHSA